MKNEPTNGEIAIILKYIQESLDELHRKADKAASICSYVILEKNPLLVFELNKHEIFKNHDAVKSGMVHSYCGFPVRNKDGYALGTFCIFHFSGVKEISPEKIELIEKIAIELQSRMTFDDIDIY